MKKYRYYLPILVLLITLIPIAVFASDVSDAWWKATVRVTNGGDATANVSTTFTANTSALIDSDYISDDCSDTAIQYGGEDIAFMPGYDDNPWVVFAQGSIPYGANIDYDFYSGGATGGKICYFPGEGGMTTADNESLEYSDNFTYEYSGYVNTSVTGNISKKDNAFWVGVPETGNITAQIVGTSANVTSAGVASGDYILSIKTGIAEGASSINETLRPNAAGEETYLTPSAGDNYACVDEEVADEMASYVVSPYPGLYDLYNIPTNPLGMIDKITVFCRCLATDDNYYFFANAVAIIKTEGTIYYGDSYDFAAADTWYSISEEWPNNPSNGLPWSWDDIDSMQIGVYLDDGGYPYVYCTQVYVVVNYSPLSLLLFLDDIEEDSSNLGLITVPDTDNDWEDGDPDVTPYIEYVKRYIDGVLQQHITWEYDTTFTDQSGNDHNATPTFRTESSDEDVSASLINWQPREEAKVDSFTLISSYEILTGDLELPDNMFSEGDYSKIPAEPINEILDEAGIPQAAWWLPFIFLSICIVGMIAYGATSMARGQTGKITEGQLDGSLLFMVIIVEVLLVVIGKMGPIPYWPAYLFPIAGVAIILSKKHFSWG